ncbi:MAG: UDP-glucose 4-epimerase GalE [Candidatus Lernaella stagnicola]|nr:UDP-glucose 4-epimerase GalE [Candidatus Lernaella stagnicola]
MTVLVAGGAGYIGSVTAAELLDAGYEVVVYDNLDRGHRAAVPPGAEFIEAELGDSDTLTRVLRDYEVETIMHFAAHSLVPESMAYPELYYENNVVVGKRILDAMMRAGVNFIIFSSTCATFGEPNEVPIHEQIAQNPTSPYGETKLAFEKMLQWYHRVHGLNYSILRYFNAAGAAHGLGEDHDPETHLIPIVLQVALDQRKHISIFGEDYPTPDGTCVRDYIHIVDLARAHILAMQKKSEEATHFNLGNGTGYSVKEVIEVARGITGHPIPAVTAPRRPGDPPALIGAADKIKRELGWEPRFPDLESIIASAWAWHQAHPRGYKK